MAKSADAFRTISEVADWLGVQTHVLRFWESKFTQVKPVKRAGGRRYYRPADMLLLGGIQKLLHEDGLTIKGVQKVLREKGMAHVSALSPAVDGHEIEETVQEPPAIQPLLDVEPATADVLPFSQDRNDIPKEQSRPSFTDDAVVMPVEADEAVTTPTDSTQDEVKHQDQMPHDTITATTGTPFVETTTDEDTVDIPTSETVQSEEHSISNVTEKEPQFQETTEPDALQSSHETVDTTDEAHEAAVSSEQAIESEPTDNYQPVYGAKIENTVSEDEDHAEQSTQSGDLFQRLEAPATVPEVDNVATQELFAETPEQLEKQEDTGELSSEFDKIDTDSDELSAEATDNEFSDDAGSALEHSMEPQTDQSVETPLEQFEEKPVVLEDEDFPAPTFETNDELTETETEALIDEGNAESPPILPSFMNRSTTLPVAGLVDDTANEEPIELEEAPSEDDDQDHTPSSEIDDTTPPIADDEAPKPRVIEVTLPPLESEISVSPRALAALAKTESLSSAQASVIVPLLKRLRNVRDRMSAQGKE